MTAKEKIDQLRAELHRHNYNYYVLNDPEISDKEFDEHDAGIAGYGARTP
jgi:DNA ligase (NAD+)